MASNREPIPDFVDDPVAYAEETGKMIKELNGYLFPPWRWPTWYRRRREIEERLRNLRVFEQSIEAPTSKDG